LDCPDGELSILFVDDHQIAGLNRDYLNRKGPTNVIAFPMRQGDHTEISPALLGDVVISMDTCVKEAQTAGLATQKRLDQLLIHGILHLFGHDHVDSDEKARRMKAKSDELLSLLDK
jgi:probable rRNA maturation factor